MSAPDEAEIARIKAGLEDLMADYVRSHWAYREFVRQWSERNPRGFRFAGRQKQESAR